MKDYFCVVAGFIEVCASNKVTYVTAVMRLRI